MKTIPTLDQLLILPSHCVTDHRIISFSTQSVKHFRFWVALFGTQNRDLLPTLSFMKHAARGIKIIAFVDPQDWESNTEEGRKKIKDHVYSRVVSYGTQVLLSDLNNGSKTGGTTK